MRQAGVLAACCLYGLERLEGNLRKDLANAKRLAEGIHSLRGDGVFSIDFANIDTNIVNMRITHDKLTAEELVERLQRVITKSFVKVYLLIIFSNVILCTDHQRREGTIEKVNCRQGGRI